MKSNGALLYPEPQEILNLLEMGKKLYPEYPQLDTKYKTWTFYDHIQSSSVFIVITKDDGALWIHWYEFLIRWIIPKIDIPFSSQWRAFVIDSKDPIHFVYYEFQRRKL